jgi:hypothetical protein
MVRSVRFVIVHKESLPHAAAAQVAIWRIAATSKALDSPLLEIVPSPVKQAPQLEIGEV